MNDRKWSILHHTPHIKHDLQKVIDILLQNRGLTTEKEKKKFLMPILPVKISVKSLRLRKNEITKAIKRIEIAKKKKEKVIVFGDYDADGVCATAVLWECLYELGIDALPYIPDRFEEGYGLKVKSLEKIKIQNPNVKLIITVDNGIVANKAINKSNELGIDVIITDHHLKGKKIPKAHSIIHTTQIGGAAIAWMLAREVRKKLKNSKTQKLQKGLDLAAIGTISDQLPLIGPNRSFAKYGLEALNVTKRPGLLALFDEAQITPGSLGIYDVNFIIAPRLNAMGRLGHAIESLRLLCTKSRQKAQKLAYDLGKTNRQRQKIVDEVVEHARSVVGKKDLKGIIIISHERYHEGVIGLAASKLVEEFWRPAIVLSKGKRFSKASARSITGFNIIDAIREFDDMLIDGGGHPMAAGFTIETAKLELFSRKIRQASKRLLTDEILAKKLKVDLEVPYDILSFGLTKKMARLAPYGIGNPTPTFATKGVEVKSSKAVGRDYKHLKLTLTKDDKTLDAIAFSFGNLSRVLTNGVKIDVAYNLEENTWNGDTHLQLKVKDIKFA